MSNFMPRLNGHFTANLKTTICLWLFVCLQAHTTVLTCMLLAFAGCTAAGRLLRRLCCTPCTAGHPTLIRCHKQALALCSLHMHAVPVCISGHLKCAHFLCDSKTTALAPQQAANSILQSPPQLQAPYWHQDLRLLRPQLQHPRLLYWTR